MTTTHVKHKSSALARYVDAQEIHPELITYDEFQASDITGFSVKTLRQRRWNRKSPPYLKMGSKIRYRERDLLKFLDSATVHPRDEQ